MKHISEMVTLLVLSAMLLATCDNQNKRDLWDAAIDYVDSRGKWCSPEIPYTIKHNSEIK